MCLSCLYGNFRYETCKLCKKDFLACELSDIRMTQDVTPIIQNVIHKKNEEKDVTPIIQNVIHKKNEEKDLVEVSPGEYVYASDLNVYQQLPYEKDIERAIARYKSIVEKYRTISVCIGCYNLIDDVKSNSAVFKKDVEKLRRVPRRSSTKPVWKV